VTLLRLYRASVINQVPHALMRGNLLHRWNTCLKRTQSGSTYVQPRIYWMARKLQCHLAMTIASGKHTYLGSICH